MTVELSLAEKKLLAALPADGTPARADGLGFATAGEALRAAGAPERHGLVAVTGETTVQYALTEEGLRYKQIGLPERRAVTALQDHDGRLPMGGLSTVLDGPEVKVAIGWLKRKGWVDIQGGVLVLRGDLPQWGEDEYALDALGTEPVVYTGEMIPTMVQRGLVQGLESIVHFLALTDAGQEFVKTLEDVSDAHEVNQVTPELVARWAEMTGEEKAKVHLRRFDFDVPVAGRFPGKKHPLTQIMERIRSIFWKMGFQEIGGDYVESAFWNMDALFIPQDHPAREEHDTFYLSDPARLDVDPDDLVRGKAVHETGGGTGSTGWGGRWSEDVARQGLLRTHTTNTTVRHLAENPKGQHKVFGLGRVFRNETMDATHLPEFHQIEGIVSEPGADFNMLVGLCKVFFAAMGFPEVRFRPAYFPYTEPSMEIDVKYHGRWMELGGCGVFRPEVTEPLGVEDPVLAWGFGLERLAMMTLGLKDIRDLYLSDLKWLQQEPLL